MAIWEGFLIGLATVIFWGPVFFTLLNATLQYGFKAGVIASVGIVFSDLIAVLLCYLASPLVLHGVSQFWLTLVGAVILLVMGIKYIVKPIQIKHAPLHLPKRNVSSIFFKGFIINFSSPFTFAYWIGTVAYGKLNYSEEWEMVVFITAILAGIFFIDLLKVFLSGQIKRLLKAAYLKKISIVCGIVLIGFSVRFFWYLLFKLPG